MVALIILGVLLAIIVLILLIPVGVDLGYEEGKLHVSKKFKVDRFVLRYVAAGWDPAETAITYGWVNAALSSLAPLCRERFTVKDCEVRTDIDFMADWMHLDFGLCVTIRIGQILGTVFGIGFSALKILLKNKLRLKKEARLNPPEPETKAAETDEKTDNSTIQEEERKQP